MPIRRKFKDRFNTLSKQFPVVCVLGARQCGKTTFVKNSLKKFSYFDLEKTSTFAQIINDPEFFLESMTSQDIVLDEVQRVPSLFPPLRSFIDDHLKRKEKIVLLGSASFELIEAISESLAGRVGFLDMTPFQWDEVNDWEALWFRGGFPRAYLQNKDDLRLDWFDNYVRTFIDRDLKAMGIEVSSVQMRKLWTMLSHVHANLWNASEMGGSLGINYHTVNRYVDILEKAFLVRRLPPYFVNLGKRLIKSPKVYIRDSGILHFFLGVQDRASWMHHVKRGASWEGFVIEQVLGWLGRQTNIESFFYATSTGQELDLLLKKGNRLLPIEIKLHTAPTRSDVSGLYTAMKDLNLSEGYVVHPKGDTYSLGDGVKVVSFEKLFGVIKEKIL